MTASPTPGPGDEDQRREHVRVRVDGDCTVQLEGREGAHADLVDLSGTGCALRLREPAEVGERGLVSLEFEEWSVEARFVVHYLRPDPVQGGTLAGVGFEGLARADVDRLVREVFVELRRQMSAHRNESG